MTGTIFVGRVSTIEGIRVFAATDPDMVMAHMAEYAYAGELVDCGDDATSRKRFEMMGHDEYLNQCEMELDNNYWEIAEVNLLNDWPSPEEYKPVEATGMSADVIAAWLTLIVMAKAKK